MYSKTLEVWKFCDKNLLSDNKRFDCSEASDFDVRCWGSSDFKQRHRLPTYILEPFSYNSAVDGVMKMVVIAVPSVSSPAHSIPKKLGRDDDISIKNPLDLLRKMRIFHCYVTLPECII